jgi:hypothetical protein
MADTRGCWSLSEAWAEKSAAEWIPIPNVWLSADNNIGYWVGGGPSPSSKSVVDKMNYSSNTTARVPGADISAPKNDNTCAGTSTEGFSFYGFNGSSYFRSVEKITYATDTQDTAGNLPNPTRSAACAIGSPTKAYVTGGYYPGGPIDGTSTYVYATGSGGTMPGVGSYFSMAGSGNTTHGYVGGGPNPNSLMFKFTYASDSEAQLPGSPLSTPGGRKKPLSAASSTGSYFTGGNPGPMTTTDKLTFATDACARIPGADALSGIAYMQGTGNSNSAYMLNYNAVTFQNLSYSTDTYSNLPGGANLSVNRGTSFGCVSGRGNNQPDANVSETRWFDDAAKTNNNAYNGGGAGPSSGNARNSITKFDFSTDTVEDISPSSTLSSGRYNVGAVSSPSAGYWMGGHNGYGAFSRVDKLTYATDSVAYTPGANLSGTRYGSYCTGNTTKGYSGGANTSGDGVGSVMDRLTYATDTTTRLPGSNLTETRIRCGVAGSLTVGYWMGSAFERSTTDRMTYSTESVAVVPGAQLPTKRGAMGACASATDVYAAGGRQSPGDAKTSQILKLNLSSESISVDASLASIRYGVSGTGDATKGYFIGGSVGPVYPNGARTSVNKFVYSTSTVTTFDQPLVSWESGSTARRENSLPSQDPPTATPTASKSPGPAFNGALWMGGYTPSNSVVSSGGKISFVDYTVTALPSTHLTGNRYNLAATSSSLAGYYGQAQTSQIVKVDYTTSSPSTLSGGLSNGSDPRRRGAAFGLKTAGYFMQGSTGSSGNLNNLDKIPYSTEVIARLPGSNTPNGAYATVGTSNQTAGYQTGGTPGGSSMYKLPFATESWSSVPSLGVEMWDANSFANTTHGYFMGGSGNATGSRTYKLTFSTDSSSRLPSSNVPQNIRYGWGSGNSSYGYMSGQQKLSPSVDGTSIIYKLNYSNDSWSTSTNNANPATRQNAGAGARQSGNGDVATNTIPNVI